MERIACAFTSHRPHKFPWTNDEADPISRVVIHSDSQAKGGEGNVCL